MRVLVDRYFVASGRNNGERERERRHPLTGTRRKIGSAGFQYSAPHHAPALDFPRNFLFRAERTRRICQYQPPRVIRIAFITRSLSRCCELVNSKTREREREKERKGTLLNNYLSPFVLRVSNNSKNFPRYIYTLSKRIL